MCVPYFRDLMWLSLSLMLVYSEEKDISCGTHFTTRAGSISTPNYPKEYTPNLFCVWTISASGQDPEIKLKFSDFLLPEKVNGECRDYVSIYHGMDDLTSNILGTYCGSDLPPTRIIKENSVRIQFESDQDSIGASGFVMSFTVSVSSTAITTSQATAGIVAAIFCGIVFIGVAAMRCIMMGACQHCRTAQPNQPNRECVGTNETLSNYVMDCPPSYRTVMEHPEHFPTPHITPYPTPTSSPRMSRIGEDDEDDDGEPPPPYSSCKTGTAVSDTQPMTTNISTSQPITEYEVAARHFRTNVIVVETHNDSSSHRSTISNTETNTGSLSTGGTVDQRDIGEISSQNDSGINDQIICNGTIDQRSGDGTIDQSNRNGISEMDSHEINNQSNGTTDQRSGNGATDQSNRNGISQIDSNEMNNQNNGTIDQRGGNGTIDQNNRNGINQIETDEINNQSNGATDQTGNTRKQDLNDESTNHYLEVRL